MTRVLIVEDSTLMLRVFSDIFENEGYEVITAGDGETALRRFSEESPGLVVTDCLIPKVDGFKLVANLRELEKEIRTPVVMISAIYRKAGYKQVAMKAGADLYLVKPESSEERRAFIDSIDKLLNGISSSRPDDEIREGDRVVQQL